MTRFSLFNPTSNAWRMTRTDWTSAEEYAAHLYSDERMAPRADIFCDIAAPIYQEMAERHRYQHLVAYSRELPDRWRERLQDAARRYPVLRPVQVQEGSVNWVREVRKVLTGEAVIRDTMVFAFRVDDDDLLAVDFLDRVAPQVTPAHHGYAISMARGYAALYEDGHYSDVRHYRQLLPSMGQGAIGMWHAARKDLELTVVKNHNQTYRNRTVLLDGTRPTWLQTRHSGQDTAVGEREDRSDLAAARRAVRARLQDLEPVANLAEVYQVFPTLRGRVS